MKSKHVLPLQVESFALLVKRLKAVKNKADIFEIWLDQMRVKGDLTVIHIYFQVQIIGKTENLEMAKRAVKAGLDYVDIPVGLEVDEEFGTLLRNKPTKVIRSFHDFDGTPSVEELNKICAQMQEEKADFYKIATWIREPADSERLLALLARPDLHDRLIVTGMGPLARDIRIQAPLKGSVMYFAPLTLETASAPGQLTQTELEAEWAKR